MTTPTRRHFLALAGGLTLGLLGSATGLAAGDVEKRGSDARDLAKGNNQFAWELYQQLRSEKGNLFVSPYSISTALAMTATGARGETASEMTKVLHLEGDAGKYSGQFQQMQTQLLDQAKGYELRIANALWGQQAHPFKEEFIAGLQQRYRAEGRTLDFVKDAEGSRATINRWVEEMTKDKIKELIPSGVLDRTTRLVLTNAIYFKGKWDKPFNKESTRPADFHLAVEKVQVDTMNSLRKIGYAENENVQVVELPYEGGRLAMVVILPRKKDGLEQVEASLTSDGVDKLMRGLKSRRVDLYLPRSKTTAAFKLKPTLQAMGMRRAFSESGEADFSGMDGTRELFIGEVLHKAFCEINEEGTEAAGATGVVIRKLAAPVEDEPVEFKADHPYLYMIRDTQTGSLLFLGRMTDPRP